MGASVYLEITQRGEGVFVWDLFLEGGEVPSVPAESAARHAEAVEQSLTLAAHDPAGAGRLVFVQVVPAHGELTPCGGSPSQD
jgi:hypothetical protein